MKELITSIWKDKYRWVDSDGNSKESTPDESKLRVAKGIFKNDPDYLEEGYNSMAQLHFAPGGRILAGAGTDKRVTLINCFASPTVRDSMDGIMHALTVAAFTQQQGGGIGIDFSTVRPNGAIVRRTNSISTGVLPFMDMWHSMCSTIKSSGSRRGAMMGTLADWHPDLLDFIKAKQVKGRLTNFNVSVLVSDALMKAVEEDGYWDMGFGVSLFDKDPVAIIETKNLTTVSSYWKDLCETWGPEWYVYKRVKARELWAAIIENTYNWAEPGVLFIDRINQRNNLRYVETIHTTNPCLTKEMWVDVEEGAKQVKDLIGVPFNARLDGKSYRSAGFFSTGSKQVYKVETKEGFELRATANHRVRMSDGDWKEVGELQAGDELEVGRGVEMGLMDEKGYLTGYLFGDGWFGHKEERSALQVESGRGFEELVGAIHTNSFGVERSWTELGERKQAVLRSPELYKYLREEEITAKEMGQIEGKGIHFLASFVAGLTDADGTVVHNPEKGSYIRIYQSNKPLLQSVQRILLRMGVYGKIYKQREAREKIQLPGGEYDCKAQFCFHISGKDLLKFWLKIPLQVKAMELELLVKGNERGWYDKSAIATVVDVVEDGLDEVYDVQVPGVNAYCSNGLVSHNCGEQPLPDEGACDLGAVNLAMMVSNPFSDSAEPNWADIRRATKIGVRFLDNVLDVTQYPTEEQRREALDKRRIGLGILGLGNFLQQMKLRYGSPQAIDITGHVMGMIKEVAYNTSVDLAVERGPFPLFNKDAFLQAPFIQSLTEETRLRIASHGIRNGVLLTIAPTGTTSIYYGNVSSGLEPTFSWRYFRKILMPDNSYQEFPVEDFGFTEYKRAMGLNPDLGPEDTTLPPYMVTALELSPEDHLLTQAVCQRYIDASVSKTINCPKEMTLETFGDIYTRAYELGLKGCTTFRPSDVRGSVLSLEAEIKAPAPTIVQTRPEKLIGSTYKLKWPQVDQAFYITINDMEAPDGTRRPFEIFINSKSVQHQEWIVALTRTISAVFRKFEDPTFLVEELEQVYSPLGGTFLKGKGYVPSIVAMIGHTIEEHLTDIGMLNKRNVTEWAAGDFCPKCMKKAYIREESCSRCLACGYSSCG